MLLANNTRWWRAWGQDANEASFNLVGNMTFAEQVQFIQGTPWGNKFERRKIDAVSRLLVPPLHLQDGPQGFRTLEVEQLGQVTAWPCLLAAASTWDAPLVRRLAAAIGSEVRRADSNPGRECGCFTRALD